MTDVKMCLFICGFITSTKELVFLPGFICVFALIAK